MRRGLAFAGALFAALLGACADRGDRSAPLPEGAAPAGELTVIESDGWVLRGTFRHPETRAIKPAALLLHRAAGSRAEYEALAEALTERGISSLALDLRGHGESVNLGRFEEPYSEHLHINEGAERDVAAALKSERGD